MIIPIPEILFSPKKTFRELETFPSAANSMLIAASAWLSLIASLAMLSGQPFTLGQFFAAYLFSAVFFLAITLAKSLLMHFFAEILGGAGSMTRFMLLLAYALLPLHFCLPASLMLKGAPWFLTAPVFILIFCWTSHLGMKALQTHYGLSWARSLAASMAPSVLLIFPLAAIAFVSSFFMGLAFLASQIAAHVTQAL